MSAQVLILGGGLSGLAAAHILHKAGIGFQLVEARSRLGGRILSLDATGGPGAIDLGPSWFWSGAQPGFAAFVHQQGIADFAQSDEGAVMVERDRGPAQRYPGIAQHQASRRMSGGTATLIAALARDLPHEAIHLDTKVQQLTCHSTGVVLHAEDGRSFSAGHVLAALPPRLLAANVGFDPPLPAATLTLWRATPTWMAPHAKFAALYDRPFWRDAGLSGAARSMIGPLVEVHDATTSAGQAALFGFVGIPADARRRAGEAAVVAAALRQLGHLFGADARQPQATLYKDWADDPLTATDDDQAAQDHPVPIWHPWVEGAWQDRLIMIGSETSLTEPGYLAGALEAAQRGAALVMSRLARQPSEG
jgi:monoamine oxidase